MSEPNKDHLAAKQYHVVMVEKADPIPDWLHEDNWHRYIVEQGDRRIEGYRAGSLKSVTQYAEEVARDLTERAMTGRSSYAVTRSKGKKPATPAAAKT